MIILRINIIKTKMYSTQLINLMKLNVIISKQTKLINRSSNYFINLI